MIIRKLSTNMNWDEHFVYDETSPSHLRWCRTVQDCVCEGVFAGSFNTAGFWEVTVNLVKYRVQQVVYEMTHKSSILKGAWLGSVSNNYAQNCKEFLSVCDYKNRPRGIKCAQ